jgi:hypothetical protein
MSEWEARIAAILARDAEERSGEGGLGQFTLSILVGKETGWTYHGGEKGRDWILTLFYSDGTTKVVRTEKNRGIPALA